MAPPIHHKSSVIGHKTVRGSLARLHKRGKLPTTMLFAGAAGIGKRQVALELARTILCEGSPSSKDLGGCGTCSTCKLIESGNFPDLYQIACSDKDEWGVEGIKDLLYSLNLSSFSGRGRVIIFNDAELLQTASANSLLKSLEEPRPHTWFILVTSNPSKLPQTILSRSQAWFFNPLSESEVREALMLSRSIPRDTKEASESKEIPLDELVLLADGSPGSVDDIEAHVDTWREYRETLQAIHKGDIQFGVQFANTLSRDKEKLPGALKLLRIAIRTEMLRNPTIPQWSVALTNIIAAERCIFERNLSAATVLTVALLSLSTSEKGSQYTALTNSATLLDRIVL